MPANDVFQVQLQDGSTLVIGSVGDRLRWSSCYLRNGFTDGVIRLFTYGQGEPVPMTSNLTGRVIAQKRHTNLQVGRTMSGSEYFRVLRIRTEVFMGFLEADDISSLSIGGSGIMPPGHVLHALSESIVLELKITQAIAHHAPISFYSAGFGPHGGVSGATFGLPSNEATKWFSEEIFIGPDAEYSVDLIRGDSNPGVGGLFNPEDSSRSSVLFIRVFLEGIHRRTAR